MPLSHIPFELSTRFNQALVEIPRHLVVSE
jgi:hypothetical protein